MSVETLENSHTQKNIRIHQLSQEDPVSNVTDFQVLRNLSGSKDILDFMNRISAIILQLGFEDYSFARIGSHDGPEIPIRTSPKELISLYNEEELYKADITLEYVSHNNQPVFQSDLFRHIESTPYLTDSVRINQQLRRLSKSFGYYDFYIIPCCALNGGGKVVLTISSKDMDPNELRRRIDRSKSVFLQIGEAIDFIGTRQFPDFFLGDADCTDIVITPRPLELLTVLAQEDMSLNEAAEFLNRSIYTVNQQIAIARKAFGADTNHGAVYQAIREGLIDCKR